MREIEMNLINGNLSKIENKMIRLISKLKSINLYLLL
jgi:hypothetical protein